MGGGLSGLAVIIESSWSEFVTHDMGFMDSYLDTWEYIGGPNVSEVFIITLVLFCCWIIWSMDSFGGWVFPSWGFFQGISCVIFDSCVFYSLACGFEYLFEFLSLLGYVELSLDGCPFPYKWYQSFHGWRFFVITLGWKNVG
jgi:hypothetical protein